MRPSVGLTLTRSLKSHLKLRPAVWQQPALWTSSPTFVAVRAASTRVPKIAPEEEKYIVRSPYSDVEIPKVNLADFVWKDVEKHKDNIALVKIIWILFKFSLFTKQTINLFIQIIN